MSTKYFRRVRNMSRVILGIDPDIKTHSCALITPGGQMYCFLRKTKLPKRKNKYTQEEKLAYAAKDIARMKMELKELTDDKEMQFHIYLEHQNAAHAAREKKIRWQDIINLAHIAGIWSGMIYRTFPITRTTTNIIYARTWKQQKSKWIDQKGTLETLGIKYKKMGGKMPYAVPSDPEVVKAMFQFSYETQPNDGDFADINDSIGLALYGFNDMIKQDKVAEHRRKKGIEIISETYNNDDEEYIFTKFKES